MILPERMGCDTLHFSTAANCNCGDGLPPELLPGALECRRGFRCVMGPPPVLEGEQLQQELGPPFDLFRCVHLCGSMEIRI